MRRFAATVLAGATMLAADVAAAATPSVTALSFLLDSRMTTGFLVDSDALASARSDRVTVRAFARRESDGRAAVLADLVAWGEAQRHAREVNAANPTIDRLGRIFGATDDQIVIDALAPPPDLARLAALRGEAFDDFYVAAQTRALARLVALDKEFILNGDDQSLRALAVHDLPRVERLLAEVRRLR